MLLGYGEAETKLHVFLILALDISVMSFTLPPIYIEGTVPRNLSDRRYLTRYAPVG
jgi:hypothetical protein